MHRGGIRDGDVGITVGHTVLMMAIYSYFIGMSVVWEGNAWALNRFWLGSVGRRSPTTLFVFGIIEKWQQHRKLLDFRVEMTLSNHHGKVFVFRVFVCLIHVFLIVR